MCITHATAASELPTKITTRGNFGAIAVKAASTVDQPALEWRLFKKVYED